MNSQDIWTFLSTQGADFGLKLLGALDTWVIGRWLIGFALRLMGAALRRDGKVDQTLANYLT
jgi:small conductance mechanosensitive channel